MGASPLIGCTILQQRRRQRQALIRILLWRDVLQSVCLYVCLFVSLSDASIPEMNKSTNLVRLKIRPCLLSAMTVL